jgi:hypothetical protein
MIERLMSDDLEAGLHMRRFARRDATREDEDLAPELEHDLMG